MKKSFLLITSLVLVLVVGFACEKKGDKNAIRPDYSATGNPNPNNQTVTGAASFSNPATQNTSLLVGNIGWSNLTCSSTGSTSLRANSGGTDVTLNFAGAATSGTYAIATVASPGTACAMTIVNAPNQPGGIVWIGKSGVVAVATTSAAITATFQNVVCTQQNFNFPTVSASGTLSCN